ncbi:hypothetical protein [Amycolatopsis anabasis]|uniref:hypothetical protein n=1 Tax=Amycolatopsis anabasis TaxID=1840409 RepID=UPI00131B72FF|nr:hypothetical protein [Amycolatopsis anabasis]
MIAWVLRVLIAAGLLGSAWVHLDLWLNDGFADIDVIGPLFLVNVVAGAVLALAVLLWHHWLPVLGAIGFGAATLVAYLVSVTVGLFGVREEFQTQAEVWGVVTEAACVLFGIALLFARRREDART